MIRRTTLAVVAFASLEAADGFAQSRAAGAVWRPADSGRVAVPGIRVVLHRVGRASQGPIDTATTDAAGRFAFRFPTDTTANFLLSARYAGIEYFSAPLATNPARQDSGIELLVYDTTSAGSLRARSRTLVVSAPDAIGARTVIDWIVIENGEKVTRVGADSTAPTWGGRMAAGARDPQVGDPRVSQISPEAVEFKADSVFVLAPLSPGQKELLLQYELGADRHRLTLPIADADSVDVFLEETNVEPPKSGWAVSDSQAFEGRRFRRLTRTTAAADLDLRFPGLGFPVEKLLPWLVAGFGVLLAILTWHFGRRTAARGDPLGDPTPIADEIGRLDRRLADATGAGRQALLARRAGLLDQLRTALARRRGRS
ncbi:MAG: hypothetical protein ACKVZ0_00730 [Gemmatimonadales bacterium]